ncbi:MAG: AAA family ATPase [Methanobacterium sp.]|nr:AAA family ATPase [Methanobacterium sp.]
MKIGILYVKGALPLFEDFGNLPTHMVNQNGMVNGNKAHKELDGLIIPGGSIIESESTGPDAKKEIKKMAAQGSFILGMCSGFQLLANSTDIGRRSPQPIIKEGLGILDVKFSPMISNDRVEAEIVSESFLTKGMINQVITGFHCHTYGNIQGDAHPICFSPVKRTDYTDNSRKILSGVKNDEGNVVGIMLHGSLDENPLLTQNILKYMDADEKDILNIQSKNTDLKNKIKREIGVSTDIFANYKLKSEWGHDKMDQKTAKYPSMIMMASTGSDSGKTFLTTGLVGALRRKGYRIGVLKVGPDIRDIVPSLYLNKEKMENFSSIKIGNLGWKDLEKVLEDIKSENYDLVIIEGVMGIFTGTLNEEIPYSSLEIAKAGNIPVILVSPCNKGGIETAAIDITGHVEMMNKMGIKTRGVVLNKIYNEKIAELARDYIRTKIDVNFVELIPKIRIQERGNIPEVEIKLEEFCLNAMETVQKHMDVDKILEIADQPSFQGYLSFEQILERFN